MATKVKLGAKATAAVKKARVDFFLADDIRLERDGKVTAVGLYPDRVIVLLVPPGMPEPTKKVPLLVASAAFLINIGNLAGSHKISIEISPSATFPEIPVHAHSVQTVEFVESNSANLVGRFQSLLVASFGIKTVTVRIDGVAFKRTFEIRRGAALDTSPTPPELLSAKKIQVAPRTGQSRKKALVPRKGQ